MMRRETSREAFLDEKDAENQAEAEQPFILPQVQMSTTHLLLLPLLLLLHAWGVTASQSLPEIKKEMTREEVSEYLKAVNKAVDEEDMSAKFEMRPGAIGEVSALPEAFNFAIIYNMCNIESRSVPNECHASFAIMAADSFSERLCLSTISADVPSPEKIEFSAQALISCDSGNDGCDGGVADKSLRYMVGNGIPKESCFPNYFLSSSYSEVFCPLTCENGEDMKSATYYPKSYYRISGSNAINQMYEEIYYNGPVIARMRYSSDLGSYSSGVFTHFSGDFSGYFWVRIKGWGVVYNTPYWIVETPFGPNFGIQGYMYVARGTNESGIEEMVYAVMPNVTE